MSWIFSISQEASLTVGREYKVQNERVLKKKPVQYWKVINLQLNKFIKKKKRKKVPGDFLVVQWLRLHAPNAWGLGSIPG